MQKHTELLWLVVVMCATSTTIILLLKSSQVHSSLVQTNSVRRHLGQNNINVYTNINENRSIMEFADMTLIKHRIENRVQRVKHFCENIKLKRPVLEVMGSKIIVDKKHGLSWCPVYKAASSTWMKNFAILRGILTNTTAKLIHDNLLQFSTIVKQLFLQHTDYEKIFKELETTKKFLIVRHPFERLLSAYRDKLEHIKGREYYYNHFGRHIIYRYRSNKDINSTKNMTPTFSEFLQFIVNEKYYNEHWVSYYDSCRPCFINYDYIIKFENLEEEQYFLLKKAGLFEYIRMYNDDFRNVNPYGATTSVTVQRYFRDVEKTLLKNVYELYKKDFLLFSYVPDEYYSVAKENEK